MMSVFPEKHFRFTRRYVEGKSAKHVALVEANRDVSELDQRFARNDGISVEQGRRARGAQHHEIIDGNPDDSQRII